MLTTRSLGQWLKTSLPPESGPLRRLAICTLTQTRALWSHMCSHHQTPVSSEADQLAKQLRNKGFHVVENYFTPSQCKDAIAELEKLFLKYHELTVQRSDLRLFGVELGAPIFSRFSEDPTLLSVASIINGSETINFATLGARLDYTPANAGSGEGWHRDSFPPQVKAILYLSDVSENNGPFQLIRDSANFKQLMSDTWTARLGHYQHRFTDEQVQRLLEKSPDRLITFTASAGTLILVNTSAIHRGCPIRSEKRYSLTNYYMRNDQLGPETDKHFGKRLTIQDVVP